MSRLGQATVGAAAALLGPVFLVGCAGLHGPAPRTVTDSAPQAVSSRALHPASHHYSIRQVERAFAARGIRLRNVSPKAFRGLMAMLDARPSHAVYVYVSLEACKCAFKPPIRNASVTHHGNVAVLWRPAEKSAVRAALHELG